MTREQQRQRKELKTELPKIIKEIAADKNLKKKDFMLYAKKGELFFDCHIFVSVNDANECICSTSESLKPMWIDDLLWELLDMKDNSKAPVSLRAIGAFAVSGAKIYENSTILSSWTKEELRDIVREYINHFCESIDTADNSVFEDNLSRSYHGELREALYYIHTGQYQKALDVVGDDEGCFTNGDLNINDAIRAYAGKHMHCS